MQINNVIVIVLTWTLSFATVHAFFIRHRQRNSKNQACLLSAPSASVTFKPNQEEDDEGSINSSSVDNEEEYIAFIKQTKTLSESRNLKLEQVLNARDLASSNNSTIQPGRIFRTGRLSDASGHDIQLLMKKIELKTLIDLRSPAELKDDTALMRPEVYGGFTSVVWKDRGRNRDGCVRVLESGEFPAKEKFWKLGRRAQDVVDDMIAEKNLDDNQHDDDDDDDDDCDCDDLGGMIASRYKNGENKKERLFVPLMNEFKYVKGTLSKLRKRDIFRACLKSPGSIFSRRVRVSIKKPFLDEINNGGLQMLNELLFRYGAPGIRFALEICADKNRHPVAFYCTAGKDRTGAIASIILSLCGVDINDIVEDYSLSANVYAEMNDHKAMVGALSQRNLDPKVFLGAPPRVMRDTLTNIKDQYGSVEAYCEWIGFDREKQQQLRDALLK